MVNVDFQKKPLIEFVLLFAYDISPLTRVVASTTLISLEISVSGGEFNVASISKFSLVVIVLKAQ